MSENGSSICLICGKKATLAADNIDGYMEGQQFNIFHCSHCDTNFAGNKELDTDVYQHIYSNAEVTPGYNRYYHFASTVKDHSDSLSYLASQEAMYWSVKEVISKNNISKDAAILEVGCGLGYLTYSLRKAGYNATGLDISKNAVELAKKNFGDFYVEGDIFELTGASAPKYDLIILTEVIEHVPSPKDFVECLVKMLKPEGKIIITTPNKSVGDQSNPWSTELPPVHLWWFSEKSFQSIAESLNCKVSFVDFTRFNRGFFDKMRFKVYKPHKYTSTLDRNGKLLAPQPWQNPAKGLEHFVWQTMLWFSNFPGFHQLLTRKEYPITRSSTLALVLSKKK